MGTALVLALALAAAAATTASEAIAQQAYVDPEVYADLERGDRARVIVVMREPEEGDVTSSFAFSSPAAYLDEILADMGVENVGTIEGTPVAVAELGQATAVERLRTDPAVELVVKDEADPPVLLQAVGLMGAVDLWQRGVDGSGHAVAVLDTGVDADHEFLRNKIIRQACFSVRDERNGVEDLCPAGELLETGVVRDTSANSAGGCPNETPGCSHGTHVAGIAAGEQIDDPEAAGETIAGVAKGADIIAIQVFSRFTRPEDCRGRPLCVKSFRSAQLAALAEIRDFVRNEEFNIAAVNMSLGSERHTRPCDTLSPLTGVIQDLRNLGTVTFIAAGNESFRNAVAHPGCIGSALTVGAIDKQGEMALFSNRRQGLIDLVTVGVDVRSSIPGGMFTPADGTSMATPAAAGAFTVLRSAFPNATVDEIELAMERTGTPVIDPSSGVSFPAVNLSEAHEFLASTMLTAAATPAEDGAAEDGAAAPAAAAAGDELATRFIIETPRGTESEAVPSIEEAAEALVGGPAKVAPLSEGYVVLESESPVSQKALEQTLKDLPTVGRIFIDRQDLPATPKQ